MNYTLDQLKEAMDKNHAVRQDFLKTILTIASSMFAILAALHTTNNTETITQDILFLITLGLLSLGILAGGIVLYFDTVAAKSIFVQMKQVILLQLNDSEAIASGVFYNPPKIFFLLEKICYITLMLSVVSIAFYSGFKS